MAETASHQNYVLLNPRDVENYIRDICHAYNSTPFHTDYFSTATVDHACATLAPVIGKHAPSMRKAASSDFAAHNAEAIEFQAEILGRRFYVFDAQQDKALDAVVIQAAKLIQAVIDTRVTFNRLGGAPDATAAYLRPDFLYAALAVPRSEHKTIGIEHASAAPEQEPKIQKELMQTASLPAPVMLPPPTEVSMQLEDGWRIERYYDVEFLDKANAEIGNGIPVDREMWRDGRCSYYGVIDAEDKTRALFNVRNAQNLLTTCRSAPDLLPDAETAQRILKFIKFRNLSVPNNAAQTGFWQSSQNEITALLDIPENFTGQSDLLIDGLKQPFSFRNLKKMNAPLTIKNSSGVLSLGDLEETSSNVTLMNCENFADMGALRIIDHPSRYTNLYIKGCKSLTSLGQINKIGGSLDIAATPVKELPQSLKNVFGGITTDSGTFRGFGKIGRASRALARQADSTQKLLPPPSYGGPA